MNEALEEADFDENVNTVRLGPRNIPIPDEWETVPFEKAIELNPRYDRPDDGPLDFLPMDAVNEETQIVDYWTQREIDDCTTTWFKNGDTLYAKITPCTENGKIALITDLETEIGSGSTEFLVFHPREGITDEQFVYYLANMPDFRAVTISLMEGSTGRQRVPTDVFAGGLHIPLPPLPEQRRIADILSTVDEEIQQTESVINKIREIRDGIFHDIIRGGFQSHDSSIAQIGPREIQIPKSWAIQPIGNIVLEGKEGLRGGPPGGKIKKADRVSKGYKVYLQGNVIKNDFVIGDDYITEEKFEQVSGAEIKPGDILITLRGSIGKTAVVPSSAEAGILCNSLARLRVDTDLCLPKYLSYLINNSDIIDLQIESLSTDSGRKGLHNKIVSEMKIPLPEISEQKQIISLFSEFERNLSVEKNRKQELQELKRGLMQDLLTGAKRVDPTQAD